MFYDAEKLIERKNIKEITTSVLYQGNRFHPDGIYSEEIFGVPQSKRWRNEIGFINLHCYVLTPAVYEICERSCKAIIKFFNGDISLKDGKLIAGSSGDFGIPFFKENIKSLINPFLDLKITDNGKNILLQISENPEKFFVSKLLVWPPQYRPVTKVNNTIDLAPVSEQYCNLINEAQVAKMTDPRSSSFKSLSYRIQNYVYNTYKILEASLKGKGGLQRSSMLGKTMDFSGRAVIIGNPNMRPQEIGIPFEILISVFKPFFIYQATHFFVKELQALGISGSQLTTSMLVDDIKIERATVTKEQKELARLILEKAIKGKVILVKRDPSLHRLSMRALFPLIVEGSAFQLSPLLTDGFNADYDGDQMALFLPMSDTAQKQAIEKMSVKNDIFGPNGELALQLKNDVVYGIYLLSYPKLDEGRPVATYSFDSMVSLLNKTASTQTPVNYNNEVTSLGRAIIEEITGVKITDVLTKKKTNKMFEAMAETVDGDLILKRMYELTKFALKVPTIIGKEMSSRQFTLPVEYEKLKEKALASENPAEALSELTKQAMKLKQEQGSILYDLVNSGSRGSNVQMQTTMIAKGYVTDVEGNLIDKPISGNINSGLKPTEFFEASTGARKGLTDRSQMTAKTGYLSRQFVYACCSVKYDPTLDNCGTNKFLKILVDSETVVNGLIGRTMKNGQVITSSAGIMDKEIEIYSPVYCRSLKLCKTCVSKYFVERLRSTNIGILSAQTLGERGTQLTMRTFHTGGAASIQSFKDSDPRLDSVIIQEQNDVKAKTDLVITVNVEDIVSNDGDEIVTSSFKIYLEDNDEEIVLDLDYNFTLFINDKENYRMNEEEVTIEVDTETIFGSMKSSTVDMVGAITLILKLLNNKTMSPEKLVRNIFDTYASNTAMPMLPIEVMVSQMLRDPVRPMYPYRLSNYSAPAMRVGIKQIPSVENWKRGAAFENIGSAIRGSILNKTGISHSHSDLDELLKM